MMRLAIILLPSVLFLTADPVKVESGLVSGVDKDETENSTPCR